MRPKIKVGYPVIIRGEHVVKTGIVCDVADYGELGVLDVVYVDSAFKAWRKVVRWRDDHFEWVDNSGPGVLAENDPTLESFVTTVKNGRY